MAVDSLAMDQPADQPTTATAESTPAGAPGAPTRYTRIASFVFNRVEIEDVSGAVATVYVECRLSDPPVEFPAGVGLTLAEAFLDVQRRIFDQAIHGALMAHEKETSDGTRDSGHL